MRHIFVINPAAGRLKPLTLLTPPIQAAMARRKGEQYEIYATSGPGDATAFVRRRCAEQEGPLRFYSCGGDGTLNEVLQGLAGRPGVSLGLIPCGSGNDFAKMLGEGLDFFDIDCQLDGTERWVDLIRVNNRYSLNVASIGLDADVGANMSRFKRLPLVGGPAAYKFSLAYSLCRPVGHRLRVSFDREPPQERRVLLMVAANGGFYGGQFHCTPRAQIDDGLMDVCVVDKISRLRLLPLISAYKEGRHVEDPRFERIITYRRCRRLTVEADHPIDICLDGEMGRGKRFEFELLPRSLCLCLPRAAGDPFARRLQELCSARP